MAEAPSEERIDVPAEHDVLCGRGGSINSHKGNEHFRNLVEKRKRVYLTARFKREKRLIASSIVSEIRTLKGRFLARKGGKEDGYWYDIGDEKARDKTSQALRENAPSIRAEIETEIDQQRREMKQKEEGLSPMPSSQAAPHGTPPPPPYPPHPHPPHPGSYYYHQHQQYWDWYYHYYGYPHGHGPPPGPPPPHAPPPPHNYTPPGAPPPPPGYHQSWPSPPPAAAAAPRVASLEEKNSNSEGRDSQIAVNPVKAPSNTFFQSKTKTPGAVASPYDKTDATQLTQEELDHRLAVALQEKEDNAMRHRLQANPRASRRTSRSNAYSQVRRANRSSYYNAAFEQMMPSFWTKESSDNKKSGETRSAQFKEDSMTDNSLTYAPLDIDDEKNDETRAHHQIHTQEAPNSSLFSQVANQLIGNMGSWDAPCGQEHDAMHDNNIPLPKRGTDQDDPGTQVLDVRDDSMPPPAPVEIDWPSRVGSCHTWLPTATNFFSTSSATTRRHNLAPAPVSSAISPVPSYDMDTGSVGGGSLCHVFGDDQELAQALREVPSWERSMRSKSPISMGSVEESFRVRDADKRNPAANNNNPASSAMDMDWEG